MDSLSRVVCVVLFRSPEAGNGRYRWSRHHAENRIEL